MNWQRVPQGLVRSKFCHISKFCDLEHFSPRKMQKMADLLGFAFDMHGQEVVKHNH